ncbi:MAG: serine/threonine protein kinase, partial [Anaerolineae bacterium]|nr:serine/threonine protein kinase [Anaerolineae bacterium]
MDVGVQISQYKIVEHIGRGGMADVWSARDAKLNRMVAIKTIAHGLAGDSNPVDMFKQEAQTIAQMEHPHILPIYDFGEYEGQLYIVMRYVAGGSLEDLLRRGPLPINEALRMGQAIAQALDYAHRQKVVHLDLKPPNVLLDSSQSPYLADFGLATVLDREGKATNPGSGTLLYMAPEQLTSEVIDWRADLYSFAVVMFHMLTGVLPFDATPIALKQVQFHEELPPLDEINPLVPTYFTDILRRATAVDPDDRYSSLMEVIDEMWAILNTSEVGGMT